MPTISSAPEPPQPSAWHQYGASLMAVTWTTPPRAPWPGKMMRYRPGGPGMTVVAAGVVPDGTTAPPFQRTKPNRSGVAALAGEAGPTVATAAAAAVATRTTRRLRVMRNLPGDGVRCATCKQGCGSISAEGHVVDTVSYRSGGAEHERHRWWCEDPGVLAGLLLVVGGHFGRAPDLTEYVRRRDDRVVDDEGHLVQWLG